MFHGTYIQQRIQKANQLREQQANPYRNDAIRTITNKAFLQKYHFLKENPESSDNHTQSNIQAQSQTKSQIESQTESIVGRLKFMRMMGKACFLKIEDESGVLQAYLSKDDLGEETWHIVKKILEVGDIVNISGFAFVTKTQELSIHAKSFKILTKSIVPLPEKFHGLTDVELRYRQRYVDLIVNPSVKEVFVLRSKIISYIRKFFEEKGFLEVETPMLHPIPGGANARPFITHHNALGVDRYLRIAPELYLKRLIVGGFEAVFEMNRNFRNEGMDHSHNPEFSMIEFYWAYHTYKDLIALTKEFFAYLLQNLNLPRKIPHADGEIDFDEWRVLGYQESLIDIGQIPQDVVQNCAKLRAYLESKHIVLEANMNYGQLQDVAFSEYVESKLINPTFIVDYPIEISPLARRSDVDSSVADRFELFIGGKEIANGFSELNDPLDQYERFMAQVRQKDAGDEEAQYMDEDYVWALGYGMPPTAGEGIGIDRLVMLLTQSKTIKDVILFPAMKPTKTESQEIAQSQKAQKIDANTTLTSTPQRSKQ
ncbi:lysyl-tRNA synthetase [Helicobacter fennelliae]|uniref:Lysine--tRNA ligase n=2 Tax=Helicobacter fennelliae TaxID=215 RepID=T1CQ10_9HELI|nr:lysine--tRNA ligase [Helicobacter fennelliae]GAD18839.1 lysyl-tRNA synthetase [Helicobacter fennelliae MRY12-0050]SQB97491.1 lysyl-tRNA synthetase [Helicobacter fennelliae]STP07005.1 lysyl-tRNA synthetase [Helicobacter fennelliae]